MGSNPSIDLGSVPYPSTSEPTNDPSEHRTQTGSDPTAHLKPLSNRCAASVAVPRSPCWSGRYRPLTRLESPDGLHLQGVTC